MVKVDNVRLVLLVAYPVVAGDYRTRNVVVLAVGRTAVVCGLRELLAILVPGPRRPTASVTAPCHWRRVRQPSAVLTCRGREVRRLFWERPVEQWV